MSIKTFLYVGFTVFRESFRHLLILAGLTLAHLLLLLLKIASIIATCILTLWLGFMGLVILCHLIGFVKPDDTPLVMWITLLGFTVAGVIVYSFINYMIILMQAMIANGKVIPITRNEPVVFTKEPSVHVVYKNELSTATSDDMIIDGEFEEK